MPIEKQHERPGIPEIYWGAAAKNCKLSQNQFLQVDNWLKNCQGNILLWGAPGRGKTYTAIAFMYFFEKKKNINWHDQQFVSLPLFYQEWLSGFSTSEDNYEKLNKMQQRKVLILDDIGLRKPSEGFLEFLHALIDHRCNCPELITIYTTNLTSKEFNDLLGPRLISRISDGLILELKGVDMRKPENKIISINQIQKFGTF